MWSDLGNLEKAGKLDGKPVFCGKHKVSGEPFLAVQGKSQRVIVNGVDKLKDKPKGDKRTAEQIMKDLM